MALQLLADGTASALFSSLGETRRNVDIRPIGDAWQATPRFTAAEPTSTWDMAWVPYGLPTSGATTTVGPTWAYGISTPGHTNDDVTGQFLEHELVVHVIGSPDKVIATYQGWVAIAPGRSVGTLYSTGYDRDRWHVRIQPPYPDAETVGRLGSCDDGTGPLAADIVAMRERFAVAYSTGLPDDGCASGEPGAPATAQLALRPRGERDASRRVRTTVASVVPPMPAAAGAIEAVYIIDFRTA